MTLRPERTSGTEMAVTREEESMDVDSCLPTDENSSRSKKPKDQGTGEIYSKSVCFTIRLIQTVRPCLQGERVTLASGLPLHVHICSYFLRRVYEAARVTRVGGLPYLRARVTLANFSPCKHSR